MCVCVIRCGMDRRKRVCVCVCVRACVHVRVRVCVCVCVVLPQEELLHGFSNSFFVPCWILEPSSLLFSIQTSTFSGLKLTFLKLSLTTTCCDDFCIIFVILKLSFQSSLVAQ